MVNAHMSWSAWSPFHATKRLRMPAFGEHRIASTGRIPTVADRPETDIQHRY